MNRPPTRSGSNQPSATASCSSWLATRTCISVNCRLGDAFRAWGGFRADLHGGFPSVRTTPTILDIKQWASALPYASGLRLSPSWNLLACRHPPGTKIPEEPALQRNSADQASRLARQFGQACHCHKARLVSGGAVGGTRADLYKQANAAPVASCSWHE